MKNFEKIISRQKKRICEGDLSLSIFKEYAEKDKKIRKIISKIDSIKVLFPRFRKIKETDFFSDISPLDFAKGIAERIFEGEKIEYEFVLKDIPLEVRRMNIDEKLKKIYYSFLNEGFSKKSSLQEAIVLKVLHNYYYYLHKFKNFP